MAGLTYQPSQAQMRAQENRIAVGTEIDAYGKNGWLWASGLTSRDFENVIFLKYQGQNGQYFLHTFMQFFDGRSYPGAGQAHEWYEMGKTRRGVGIATVESGTGTATLTVTTTNAEETCLVGWLLNTTRGFDVRVETVAFAAGVETLTLRKYDGSNFASGDIAAGNFLGFATNSHAEASGQPKSRTWRPERKMNKYTTIKETFSYSGDAATSKHEVNLPGMEGSWIHAENAITLKEFAKSRENALMWPHMTPDSETVQRGLGIVRDIEQNAAVFIPYTDVLSEADLQDMCVQLGNVNGHTEYLVLEGSTFCKNRSLALKDYLVDGGGVYGIFNGPLKPVAVGLDITQYKFQGKTLNFREYLPFNDQDVTGAISGSTPTTVETDYRDFAMFLNLGNTNASPGQRDLMFGDRGDGGQMPYLSYKYKALGATDRSVVVGVSKGMTGMHIGNHLAQNGLGDLAGQVSNLPVPASQHVTTDKDVDSVYFLSQISPRLVAVDEAHAYMRRIG